MSENFHIITGGPSSGKTSLIHGLAAAGFHTRPEAGRDIIKDQVEIGGDALPWADRQAFALLMMGWELRSYREAQRFAGSIFFDRSIIDVIGYLQLCGLAVPAAYFRAAKAKRYARQVFIAPPWAEIFEQDSERKQDFTEAKATYAAMVAAYQLFDYELISLPLVPVAARISFIQKQVK